MSKHIPYRQCVGCREHFPKSELLRIACTDACFQMDASQKGEGRGAYVCNNPRCRQMAVKRHAFDRAFRQKVPQEIYNLLEGEEHSHG